MMDMIISKNENKNKNSLLDNVIFKFEIFEISELDKLVGKIDKNAVDEIKRLIAMSRGFRKSMLYICDGYSEILITLIQNNHAWFLRYNKHRKVIKKTSANFVKSLSNIDSIFQIWDSFNFKNTSILRELSHFVGFFLENEKLKKDIDIFSNFYKNDKVKYVYLTINKIPVLRWDIEESDGNILNCSLKIPVSKETLEGLLSKYYRPYYIYEIITVLEEYGNYI